MADDVTRMDALSSSTFDQVIDGHCLHCIIGDDRLACMRAVHRLLKPGGRFIILTMCGEVTNPRMKGDFDPATGIVSLKGLPVRFIGTHEGLIDEVKRAGFEVEHTELDLRDSIEEQDDVLIVARKI
jgi:SAM-dependent methyltransferase